MLAILLFFHGNTCPMSPSTPTIHLSACIIQYLPLPLRATDTRFDNTGRQVIVFFFIFFLKDSLIRPI